MRFQSQNCDQKFATPKGKKFLSLITALAASAVSFAQTVNFTYTGGVQNWTVPPCVTSINIVAAGADGGGANGGNGAVVNTTLSVTPGQVLQITVGGSGGCPGAGYNGGGNGNNANGGANASCGGGGASDVRIAPYGAANRVVVAAGGGGQGGGTSDAVGGAGGCATGASGTSPFGQGGGAATQSSGGPAGPPWITSGNYGTAGFSGTGGNGASDPCYNVAPGGGGGGGYFGGGGGGSDCFSSSPYGGGSGGGGSSFGGGCTAGTNNGPGYVNITYTTTLPVATATNTGPYCAGTTIQLNVTPSTAGATYSWTGPNGFTSNVQNPTIPSATAANAGTYTVTVAMGPSCTTTASTTVVVNPAPVITVNSANICLPGSATLTASGATSYTWSPATGLSATTGATVTASPTTTTTYTVTGTASGCTGTATSTVTVEPTPVITVAPATICTGQSATLTASGAATYVWSPATGLSSTTGTTVTASPTATTTYTVTGTSAAGCTGTTTVTVTVNPLPVVTATSATICAGQSATLTASGADSYAWSPSTGLSSTTGASVTANPVATTTYTITGTTNGCQATGTSTVTVNPNPVITVNSGTICGGGSIVLNASGATTYSWSPAGGLSSATGASVTASPASTTTYTVTGTTAGCTGTATATVTIAPNPVVTATSATVCSGQQAMLTASGAANYTWSPSTGLSSTTGSSVTATPTATTTYTVTGTSAAGCTGTATSTVTVNPSPAITATNTGPYCPMDDAELSATGFAGATYSWSGPNGFSYTGESGTIADVTAAEAGVYTVTASLNGCTSSTTTTMVVNPSVPVTIDQAGPYCANEASEQMTVNAPNGTWSGPGITDPSTGTFDPSSAGTGTHTITYTPPQGCWAANSIDIVVNPVPVIDFDGENLEGCVPLEVTIWDLSTPANSGIVWNFGDGTTSSENDTMTHVYQSAGEYTVSLTVTSGGCSNTLSQPAYVNVTPGADPAFDIIPGSVASVTDPNFVFINNSNNANSYVWSFGDNSGSTEEHPSHTYPQEPGSYTVTLTASTDGNCAASVTKNVTIREDLIFYVPNAFTPDGDEYNNVFQPVFHSGYDAYSFTMLIFDRWGEVLFESHDVNVGWDGTYNGKQAKDGVYTWTISFKLFGTDEKAEYNGSVTKIR